MRIPAFEYDSITFACSMPAKQWLAKDRTVGGSMVSGGGVTAGFVARRDELVALALRITEDEYADLLDLVTWGQTGGVVRVYLDTTEPAEYADCYLDAPAAGEDWEPTPNPEYPRQLDVTLTFRPVAGSGLWRPYYP